MDITFCLHFSLVYINYKGKQCILILFTIHYSIKAEISIFQKDKVPNIVALRIKFQHILGGRFTH